MVRRLIFSTFSGRITYAWRISRAELRVARRDPSWLRRVTESRSNIRCRSQPYPVERSWSSASGNLLGLEQTTVPRSHAVSSLGRAMQPLVIVNVLDRS